SWGGFNALQVAALKPPPLKAIITLCSTDDRYADDAHYMGGCLLNENMQWGAILTLNCAYPPDPEIVGDRWRDMWRERLDALEPFPALWMEHQWRTDYWKHGSVCEDYGAIDCAVYAIGGWADGYSNAVPRLLANLDCPRKGLIGPWAHVFPHDGVPRPAIGFLQEAVRWWDQWLKGRDTGIMEEPAYRVWMQESVPPRPFYEERPGRWVAETEWPSPRIVPTSLWLNANHLGAVAETPTEIAFSSPETTGVRAGEWCGFGADGEMPRDQRADDGGSLVFDSDALSGRMEILGAPTLDIDLMLDRPAAQLAARICDIAPDGSSLRVTYGLLNLCHHESHEAPAALEPGRWYRVKLALNDVAHAFPAGHRIRLALSTAYWPVAWPSPAPVIATLRTGTGAVTLPVRPPAPEDTGLPDFQPPEAAPSQGSQILRPHPMQRRIEIDLATNEMVYTLSGDGGELGGASLARLEEIGLDLGYTMMKRYRIREGDPLSAETEFNQRALFRRDGWEV
ncbi:MAG: CocE/NonD family hydrolase, partial [Bauldia litoralis]